MAKLSQIPMIDTVDPTDIVLVTNDPGGSPVSRYASFTQVAHHLGIRRVPRDLSTAEIGTLFSSPLTLVAAQGAGTAMVPVAAWFQYLAGTEPFAGHISMGIVLNDATDFLLRGDDNNGLALVSRLSLFTVPFDGGPATDLADADNQALRLTAGSDAGFTGEILTGSLNEAGTGYAINDTITLVDGGEGGVPAVITVNTVGGGGEVATFTVTNGGTRYAVAQAYQQDSTSGGGEGFEVTVTTIDPLTDGVGRIEVLYRVFELRT